MAKKMYESPAVGTDGIATPVYGGSSPGKDDIIKSANARATKRHESGGDKYADVNVLPASGGQSLDKAGINDQGYLVKKGLEFGVNANYNSLPPGMQIEDQENADIRKMEMKTIVNLGYPGDGWT
jgi:hypothetical protein